MIEFLPKKSEKIVISIRIGKDVVEKVNVVASKLDVSRNEILCQSIEFSLEQTTLDNL